ncbi:MAG: sulfatase [Tannerella sp.]|jgi:arylsulfatase|nr:sulfatase [Tannerella sp.]
MTFTVQTAAQQSDRPNIICILADDLGYGDLTVTGATGYKTPNIDRLCVEGMRFTNFYSAQAVSSASRAGILTGCYPNRIGFSGALGPNANTGIADSEEVIAEILKKKGYTCSAIGKWHLGHHPQFLPTRHGFDEYYGLPYSNDMWPFHPQNPSAYPPLPMIENEQIIDPEVTAEDQTQITTQYTERAVRFIENNKDKPFFLYLAHSMPHVPLFVSDKFKGKSEQGLYGDVMMEIDWSVGEIMKVLKKNGIDKNTLIIFTSDNGPWTNYGNHAGSSGGFREAKGTIFEGGVRVPCIMRWPEKIPAGTICNQLASTIDLLPTIANLSGAPLPTLKIDGVNITPLMMGDEKAKPREFFLYYYDRNNLKAVRNDRFKLVLQHMGRTYAGFLPGNDGQPGQVNERHQEYQALYDLRRDPGERYDVQNQYPEVVAELMKVVEVARLDLGDDLTGHAGTGRRAIGTLR